MENYEEQFFFRKISGEKHPLLKNTSSLYNFSFDEAQIKIFNKLVFNYGLPRKTMVESVDKIILQTNQITMALIPLYQLGFRFDLGIVGGAIRDLLLFKEHDIKDIDVLLSIEQKNLEEVFKVTPHITFQSILGEDIFDGIDFIADSSLKIFYNLVRKILSKKFTLDKFIHIEDIMMKKDQYGKLVANKSLEGVIKFHTEENEYPVDLLMSDISIHDYVMKTFDFDICKSYATILDKNNPHLRAYNLFSFLELIVVSPFFLQDAIDKKMTIYMPKQKTLDSIEDSIKFHYVRLSEKYPDFSLRLATGGQEEFEQWKKNYENYAHLNQTLPEKEEQKPVRLKI